MFLKRSFGVFSEGKGYLKGNMIDLLEHVQLRLECPRKGESSSLQPGQSAVSPTQWDQLLSHFGRQVASSFICHCDKLCVTASMRVSSSSRDPLDSVPLRSNWPGIVHKHSL